MRRLRASVILLAVLGLVWSTGRLDAQGGVGGGRAGGSRASGIGSSPGGSLGSAPRVGAGPGASRGIGGMPSSVQGTGTGTLHPRGYLDSSPSSTDAPFGTVGPGTVVPPQGAPGTPRTLSPRASARPQAPRSGVRTRAATPTVITVPRAQSIPRMGNSIPPLERTQRLPRAQVEPGSIHGFRGVDFGYRRAPGFPYRFPVVYLPLGYGYGNYESRSEQIVIVDHNTATRSRADVTRVPAATPPELIEPGESKVLEVRPREPDEPAADPRDPASVEVLRGNQAPDEEQTPLYLLARTDETIVTSQEHWLAGNTVHYITPGGEHRQILIENLDLDLTARLNHERGLSFRLEVVPQN